MTKIRVKTPTKPTLPMGELIKEYVATPLERTLRHYSLDELAEIGYCEKALIVDSLDELLFEPKEKVFGNANRILVLTKKNELYTMTWHDELDDAVIIRVDSND